MYSSFAVANFFIQLSEQGLVPELNPFKLQRLLYITQSLHLLQEGEPLFDDYFSRWAHGPVIPSLYHKLKTFESREVNQLVFIQGQECLGENTFIYPSVPKSDEKTISLILFVSSRFGFKKINELADMTNKTHCAWAKGRQDGSHIEYAEMKEDARFFQKIAEDLH